MTSEGRGVYTTTGVFVCFEGGEGAGKSTQSRALAATLEQRGYPPSSPSSPVTRPVGKEMRRIVLDPATGELSDRTEVLLYAADKAEHVDTVVLPGPRAPRGGDHRPLRRLDPGLPGRRPRPSTPARSSTSPGGRPATCAPT